MFLILFLSLFLIGTNWYDTISTDDGDGHLMFMVWWYDQS